LQHQNSHNRQDKIMLVGLPHQASAARRQLIRALSCSATNTNTLIIGGGPVGSSSAYHLARQRNGDGSGIVVVEKDPTYQSRNCSAVYSAGGIRQQFSLSENIKMSLYGRDFLRSADKLLATKDGKHYDVQFKEHGYLFLAATKSGRDQMIQNHNTQVEAGCEDIKLLEKDELKSKFPWLNSEDILLASYGEKGEGWFDPHGLIMGLKTKAIEMGVTYIHGEPVTAQRDQCNGRILSVNVKGKNGDIVTHNVNYVVNAAGAQAESAMNLLAGGPDVLSYPLPVKPRKRSIFFFHCAAKEGVPPVAPLTVDPSFVYFRSEGSGENATFLCGVSPAYDQDPDVYNHGLLDGADYYLFEDIIWPSLFHRVPSFGEIKVRSSWSGLYEYNTIDQNGIIAFHPEMANVLMLNGFSGHGLQQSPATGRAAAELIDSGGFDTLDLSIFSFDRCMGLVEPVLEQGIV
jgi:FAD-dependent oxidoreductase domain-containing protein 1